MAVPSPIYIPDNTACAFQLIWSVSVFWREPYPGTAWLPELRAMSEPAGIRILQHRTSNHDCSLFLLSTRPHMSPVEVVRGIKGRLQTIVRKERPTVIDEQHCLGVWYETCPVA